MKIKQAPRGTTALNKQLYAITDVTPQFQVKTSVIERKGVDSVFVNIYFYLSDTRTLTEKMNYDLSAEYTKEIYKAFEAIQINKLIFHKNNILVVSIPRIMSKKADCEIELVLYPLQLFDYTYSKHSKIPQINEAEDVALQLIIQLEQILAPNLL